MLLKDIYSWIFILIASAMIAVGRVAKDLISIRVEPIIPLSKIVTTGGVEEKICEISKIIKLRLNTKCQYIQILTIQLLIIIIKID